MRKEVNRLYRIIDANLNRAKEGLRVCEDVCRFILDEQQLTRRFKIVRHELTDAIGALKIMDVIEARNIQEDVGRGSIVLESKRKNVSDVFYANAQRVKESLRVLEEVAKLLDGRLAERLKKLRYRVYALEKEVFKEC